MAISLRKAATIRITRGPVVLDAPVLTSTSIFTGESSEFVVRLDKRSGKEVWRKRKPGWVRSAHGDNILVYSGDERETQLWDEAGKVRWKRRGNEVAMNGRLYFNEGGRLRAIDVMTGETADEFECPPGTPNLMHDGVLLLKHPDGTTDPVQGLDLSKRTVLWDRRLIAEISNRYQAACREGLSFVASHPGQFVASSGQHLFGVSLADGSLQWGLRVQVPYLTPQPVDGRIYIWTTAPATPSTKVTLDLGSGQVSQERSQSATGENRFVIVDEATGEIVVDRPLASYGSPFRSFQEPKRGTVCKQHIGFTTQTGLIALFRLSDGELVWQHEHGNELFSPVFEDNRLYVACADGSLVVFEGEGGEL